MITKYIELIKQRESQPDAGNEMAVNGKKKKLPPASMCLSQCKPSEKQKQHSGENGSGVFASGGNDKLM